MKHLLLSLCLLGFTINLFSQGNEPVTVEFTKKDLEKSPSGLAAVADRITFVKLETLPNALIGNASSYNCMQIPIGFIIYPGQGNEGIMLFDKAGRFKTKVGRIGKGPGEYTEYYKVRFDDYNDQILVYGFSADRVLVYSSQGQFLKTVSIKKGDVILDRLMVLDKSHWMFTYEKPLDGELNEVGVLKIDHDGQVIKKYDLTEKNNPGCYGNTPQSNLLYRSGDDILFSYLPYSKTLRLTTADSWVPAYILKSPIPECPLELYSRSGSAMMNQTEYQQENGVIISSAVYPGLIQVTGGAPKMFNILINWKTGEKYYWGFDMASREPGLIDDLAGGPPFDIRSISDDNYSVGMIDAQKILALRDKGLLGKSYKDKKSFDEMNAILDRTKIDDNPIIRIVHLK